MKDKQKKFVIVDNNFDVIDGVLQVDEDDHDHEHAHGKRRRYSPMPVVSAGAAVVSCHDEPSSSHCNDPAAAPQLELSRLQAQLVEREQQLEQQRSEAETFLRELQESVMCPVGSLKIFCQSLKNIYRCACPFPVNLLSPVVKMDT